MLTPLLIPGYYILIEETLVKKRDEYYAAFIRSLGGSAETRSIASTAALDKLRAHDFGPLTRNINDLYKRLMMRIDSIDSWRYFGAETGSELISKFSNMYVEGSMAGGRPKDASDIISDNFIRMVALRKKRYQSASSITGLLYGVAIAVAFPLYICIYVVDKVNSMILTIEMPEGYRAVAILQSVAFDIDLLNMVVLVVILIHALISALIIRVIGGGHKVGALVHFVGIFWVATIVSIIVELLMRVLLPD
jgi:flagellar protein FlaJ